MLKRDWFSFRKKALSLVFVWAVFPMVLHILIAIPLSKVIQLDIRYLNWVAPGIWIVSSGFIAFATSFYRLKKIRGNSEQLEIYLKAPMSNVQILLPIMIWACILGMIQFLFSFVLTTSINHEYYTVVQVAQIGLISLISVIFFSIIGTLFGLLIRNEFISSFSNFILHLVIAFGLGAFIPLEIYPNTFQKMIKFIPLSGIFENLQSIVQNNSIELSSIVIMLILCIVLFFVNVVLSHKKFRG